MKKRKLNLIWKILIGIALGIGIGWVAPEWCGRLAATLNYIFSQLLGFLIPLIIVGFVTPAIADVGSRAGKRRLLISSPISRSTYRLRCPS